MMSAIGGSQYVGQIFGFLYVCAECGLRSADCVYWPDTLKLTRKAGCDGGSDRGGRRLRHSSFLGRGTARGRIFCSNVWSYVDL